MAFHSYDADRDDDFVRYPCDIRLDGYRLIVQLASKAWGDEKKPDKEVKFIGCREYLIKGKYFEKKKKDYLKFFLLQKLK